MALTTAALVISVANGTATLALTLLRIRDRWRQRTPDV
jgi:hypothetical protein